MDVSDKEREEPNRNPSDTDRAAAKSVRSVNESALPPKTAPPALKRPPNNASAPTERESEIVAEPLADKSRSILVDPQTLIGPATDPNACASIAPVISVPAVDKIDPTRKDWEILKPVAPDEPSTNEPVEEAAAALIPPATESDDPNKEHPSTERISPRAPEHLAERVVPTCASENTELIDPILTND